MSETDTSAMLAAMQEQYPEYKFRVHAKGHIVRDFSSVSSSAPMWRRVCTHNRRTNVCGECVGAYVEDTDVSKRGAPPVFYGPLTLEESDPLHGRVHEEAPFIPANLKQEYIDEQRRVILDRGLRLENGCLTYRGGCIDGMGMIFFKGRCIRISILSWILHTNRLVPDGFEIRHTCKTSSCYEPTHLEIGTKRQNLFEDKLRDDTLSHGERHHMARIDAETALAIFNSKGTGTRAERSVRFGVSTYTVKKIDTGETWSHVTGKHKARNRERERAQKRRQERTRDDATRQDYESAMIRIRERSEPGDNGCVVTTYAKDQRGYGVFGIVGRQTKTHIISWEYHHNDCCVKPDNMDVCHTCDNPPCINPGHLVLGTSSDNLNDQYERNRRKTRRTPISDVVITDGVTEEI